MEDLSITPNTRKAKKTTIYHRAILQNNSALFFLRSIFSEISVDFLKNISTYFDLFLLFYGL